MRTITEQDRGESRWNGSRVRWRWWLVRARSGPAGATARRPRSPSRARARRCFASIAMRAAAEETVKIIAGEGGKAAAFTADVSRAAEVEAMVAACLKTYGRIDVLDNNVGIAEMGNVVEVNEASWDHVFAVNLKSAYPRHEARHSGDAEAGRRFDHQYLLDRLDPPSRHFLRHLWRHEGRDEPDDAHHRRAVRPASYPGELHSAGPDEDADGRALRRTCRRAIPPAMSRRCGARATRRCRWDTWATPGTSPTPRCSWLPTSRNTSPGIELVVDGGVTLKAT